MTEQHHDKAASDRLRSLADDHDANAVTYGPEMALDILVSELSEALDALAALEADRA